MPEGPCPVVPDVAKRLTNHCFAWQINQQDSQVMHMCNFRNLLTAAALLAPLVINHTASADVVAQATRTGNFVSTNTLGSLVPLTNDGSVELAFSTTKVNQYVRVTYNAECGSKGNGGWVSVRVIVDEVEAMPNSGRAFAFCSTIYSNEFSYIGASRQSLIKIPAIGKHKVWILADVNSGATSMSLGDSSIVVDR